MKSIATAAVLALIAFPLPSLAQDDLIAPSVDADIAAGSKSFSRQCVACHMVVDPDGNKLAGRSGRSGPNLYGVAGMTAGSVDGYRYGKSIVAAGEAGLVWNRDSFVAYVQDPTGYLRTFLDNNRARAKMSFKVRNAEDAVNMYAYLHSLGPSEN